MIDRLNIEEITKYASLLQENDERFKNYMIIELEESTQDMIAKEYAGM